MGRHGDALSRHHAVSQSDGALGSRGNCFGLRLRLAQIRLPRLPRHPRRCIGPTPTRCFLETAGPLIFAIQVSSRLNVLHFAHQWGTTDQLVRVSEQTATRGYWVAGTVLRGLELLHAVFRIENHDDLVSFMRNNICWPADFELEESILSYDAQSRRQRIGFSEQDAKEERDDPLPFRDDGEPDAQDERPPLAWTYLCSGTYNNRYGHFIPVSLNDLGYLMWDAARLESMEAMDVLEERRDQLRRLQAGLSPYFVWVCHTQLMIRGHIQIQSPRPPPRPMPAGAGSHRRRWISSSRPTYYPYCSHQKPTSDILNAHGTRPSATRLPNHPRWSGEHTSRHRDTAQLVTSSPGNGTYRYCSSNALTVWSSTASPQRRKAL
ncbi:hypothetical protein N658DRAFT_202799 [Parathielavia hyrcaniae]|uniref:Uncharacterized protein n=1 Tax=Parathielavia hyrcaniae TaxID=113614 RepID=A0AAN6SZB6_9PEZI|nr:hypothetical protein N658DRAFT_202799 [Parathielavia hyrcaniae]